MKKLAAVLATLAIPLFGCSSSVELKVPLDPQEYATCPGQGSNTITGSTFGRTKGGAIMSAAGRIVHLDKWTKYAHAAYYEIREKQVKDSFFREEHEGETVKFDPTMFKCRRQATVGLDGSFRFEHVPSGEYFISTYISWLNSDHWAGVWSVTHIRVKDGEAIPPVVLSGFHYPGR